MKTLELRNLKGVYIKINKDKRNEIYHDTITKNLLIFTPYDKSCNTDSICNGIRNSMYDYLINELNTKRGIIVLWSQVHGTTSDYTIYYDVVVDEELRKMNCNSIIGILNGSVKEVGNGSHMKYTEVRNGILNAIQCDSSKDYE